MFGNNIQLTLIPPTPSHNHLLHLINDQNQQKLVHVILPLQGTNNSEKNLQQIMTHNQQSMKKHVQSALIQDEIVCITLKDLHLNLEQNVNAKMNFLKNFLKSIDPESATSLYFYDKEILSYHMEKNAQEFQSEEKKLTLYALVCYCLLSSNSLEEYLKKIKNHVWNENKNIKNDGSVRVDEQIMMMLKGILKGEIPTQNCILHTIEIIRERSSWQNKSPARTLLKEKTKKKVDKNQSYHKEAKEKKSKQSFSATGFSNSSVRKYRKSANHFKNFSQTKKHKSQHKYENSFVKDKTIESFHYSRGLGSDFFKPTNDILINDSFGATGMEIEEEKTKKLKSLLNKNKSETISREEVDQMIRKSSLCLASNVFVINVPGRQRQLKLNSNLYFLSEKFQQKNGVPSKKEPAPSEVRSHKRRNDSQLIVSEELESVSWSNNTTKRSLKKEEVTERNGLKEMPVTTENSIANNYNFLVNILNHFNTALSQDKNKWSLFTYVYYLHYALIRSLEKKTKDSSAQNEKMMEMLEKMRQTNLKKQNDPLAEYAKDILKFDFMEHLKNETALEALESIRNNSIQLLVMHFGKVSQELHNKKSEFIHRKVFKSYIKYLCMVAVAVGIVKKPTSVIAELKEFDSYSSQIDKKEPMFIDVQEEKKNLMMLLEKLFKE